jgi:uncharacterized protein (DUF2225 family)
MKIKCPFCTFSMIHKDKTHKAVLIKADMLRYHLQYECPIHNVAYMEEEK